MSDQLAAETTTCTTCNEHNRRMSMPSAVFEPCVTSDQVAADLRLRPHGHWVQLFDLCFTVIKLRRNGWVGLVAHTRERGNTYTILVVKPEGRR